ncbi:hydrogenase 3 maturation protease [Candidatus Velamenicoccus archaeovorus]|uniref:Hydrogenase 3 maturation protease n=1 Tax=Velamenicoccus archaeovorus TaxID=1930593 RepID=A0A410P4B9_VELA1|nr:hydrogenase 3 maturation endopeptidase HyCI [Candidatus Velamenicoccus archaeovorus]QAT17047.1 hydrogenase 3 maturation protease [Candidatus Velamenicoccus archaeovorus]
MQNLKTQLQKKLEGVDRLGILGIGSDLRGDDAVGLWVAKALGRKSKTAGPVEIRAFLGHTAPESLTGEIKKFRPTHLLIVDAISMDRAPGEARLFDAQDISEGISFSTHRMPLKILASYLCQSFPCSITVLGIQPQVTDFGKKPSRTVQAGARTVCRMIREILRVR